MDYKTIHPSFRLNGFQYNRFSLLKEAQRMRKEGSSHEQDLGYFILEWLNSSLHIKLKTSGTTYYHKEIKVTKQAMCDSAKATGGVFGLKPGDKALHCLPSKYVAGKMMFVRGIVLGLEIDIVEPNSYPMILAYKDYDFVAMVPMQVRNSIFNLYKIKTLIIGGIRLDSTLEEELLKLNINTKIYETYGMTETLTHIATRKIGETAFSLFPNIQIHTDQRNCLVIFIPRISKRLICTKDVVRILDDNKFIYLGRADFMVNSGGIKISPEIIEKKISSYIPSRFFVGGIPDDILGEKLVLIIEGEERRFDTSFFNLLDKYERPKRVIFVTNFAETETGKIRRNKILDDISFS